MSEQQEKNREAIVRISVDGHESAAATATATTTPLSSASNT